MKPAPAKRILIQGAETASTVAWIAVTGIACCGFFLLQWLGLLVWTIGGTAAIVFLNLYEASILTIVGALALLAWRFGSDRLIRAANAVLGLAALGFAFLRFLWSLDPDLIMASRPAYELFNIRLLVMFGLIGSVLLGRVIYLLARTGRTWRRPSRGVTERAPLAGGR